MSFDVNQLHDLLEASTVSDLYKRAKVVVSGLEFEHFIYGMRLYVDAGEAHEFVLSGYPPSWREIYEQQGYAVSDPTVAHSLSSSLPLVWSNRFFLDKGAESLMEHARQYGLRGGLTVPVHSANLQSGMLSLSSEATLLDHDVERIAHSQLFATYLHEAVRKLVKKKAGVQQTECQLTPREKECLTWAAVGKSSWEISRIVSRSERTVNFHIGNVIQKLRVTSRSHAVAKALAGGLIQM